MRNVAVYLLTAIKSSLVAKISSGIITVCLAVGSSWLYNYFGDGNKHKLFRIGENNYIKQSRNIINNHAKCGDCFISLVELEENNVSGNTDYKATFIHVVGKISGTVRNFKTEPGHNAIYDKTHYISDQCLNFLDANSKESISSNSANFVNKCNAEKITILDQLNIKIKKICTVRYKSKDKREYLLMYTTPTNFECNDCTNEMHTLKTELENINHV